MKKSLIIILFVFVVLSIAATAVVKQITADITSEKIQDCKTVYWDETSPTYGTCTYNYNTTVCSDPPKNTSCTITPESYDYQCKTGTSTVQKSKQVCADKELQFSVDKQTSIDNYKIDYGAWGKCSTSKVNNQLEIICDSKLDGNNDGKCHSGESCIKFVVTKNSITKYLKNSQPDWVQSDETFFLDELNYEVMSK
jgi:hypothetical protein